MISFKWGEWVDDLFISVSGNEPGIERTLAEVEFDDGTRVLAASMNFARGGCGCCADARRVVRYRLTTIPDERTKSTELSGFPLVLPGQYLHFNGGRYTVLGIVRCSETLRAMVRYVDENGVEWVRPAEMWGEEVAPGVRRFALVLPEESELDT